MFKEAFDKLDVESTARILDECNVAFDSVVFDPLDTTVMAIDVSFYPGFQFLDISNHTVMPPLQRYVLYKLGSVTAMDFTNAPLYAMNKSLPIMLDEESIFDYVRFFFGYVRGKHGRFLIVENVDDIGWKDDPPPTARKAIGKMIIPLTLNGAQADGSYKLTACMMFKDSLFKSDITVSKGGEVTVLNEELLIEDMPVLDDTLGQ